MLDKKEPRKGIRAIRKAIQLSFDLSDEVMESIRRKALETGYSPQDQIRSLLDLSTSKPKRPRVGLSVTNEECEILAKRFGVSPSDKAAIKSEIQKVIDNID